MGTTFRFISISVISDRKIKSPIRKRSVDPSPTICPALTVHYGHANAARRVGAVRCVVWFTVSVDH